ncbi:MAG: hypothetical protein ACK5LC_18665 [Coprobacillaceae bacterium]
MNEYGFVRIITGSTEGRIGRFIGWNEENTKVKVAFGYETDILPYVNYQYYSINSISNDISKQNVIDRYFEITQALKAIDVRGHAKIKKYSASHTSLITEYNIVRGLLQRVFQVSELDIHKNERNVVIIASTLDIVLINELALDLELKDFHVAIINQQLYLDTCKNELEYALSLANHYILMDNCIEENSINILLDNTLNTSQTVSTVVDTKEKENIKNNIYFMGNPFSDSYERSLTSMVNRFEDPESYKI